MLVDLCFKVAWFFLQFVKLDISVLGDIHHLQEGRSPLHVAVERGLSDVVKILIARGANVDTKDRVRMF